MWQTSQIRRNPPLKDRVVHCGSRSTTHYVPTSISSGDCYKQWDKVSMAHAVKAVIDDGMSIRRAAIRYGIPKSTLGDRVTGQVLPGSVSGPPKLLTDREEEELETFLYDCAKIGYAKTRKEVMSLVDRFFTVQGGR